MKNHYFFSQPHQPFFALAFLNAIVFMLVFMLSFKGILTLLLNPITFHSYSLTFLVFTPAFLAFLFTTFPRFLAQKAIVKTIYMRIFTMFFIGTFTFLVGAFTSTIVSKIGMVITFIAFIYSIKVLFTIHKNSKITNKHDTFWMLVGFSFGIVSYILMMLDFLIPLANEVAIFAYLFIVGFSVAARMIPFFSHCQVVKNKNFMRVVMGLIILHIILEFIHTNLSFMSDILLAILIAKELYRWKLPFPNKDIMLNILHIALFWVPIAFLLSFSSKIITLLNGNYFLSLDTHTLMLGFLFTVLMGFGTRVTLGHSGHKIVANKFTKFLFIWTQVVVTARVLTSLLAAIGSNYMILFDISVTVWLIMFIAWAIQFTKVLIFGKKLDI